MSMYSLTWILRPVNDLRPVHVQNKCVWCLVLYIVFVLIGYGPGYDDIVVHGDLDAPKFIAYYTK